MGNGSDCSGSRLLVEGSVLRRLVFAVAVVVVAGVVLALLALLTVLASVWCAAAVVAEVVA